MHTKTITTSWSHKSNKFLLFFALNYTEHDRTWIVYHNYVVSAQDFSYPSSIPIIHFRQIVQKFATEQ